MALKYKRALLAQSLLGEIIEREFNGVETPITNKDAVKITKALENELGELVPDDWLTADWETFELLRKKIKQKGGDLSGLELELEDLYRKRKDIFPPILPPLLPEELPPELKETELT